MTILIEIAVGLFVVASLLAAWLKPGPWIAGRARRGGPDDGGAGAGDRAARLPRVPVLSGGAAKTLGEDD
jgi:hypothetical protein